MSVCKKIFLIFLSFQISASTLTLYTFASTGDIAWENSDTYVILEYGEKSNSSIDSATVKVMYDNKINRIYMMYILTVKNFNDVTLSGLQMDFNNFGQIRLMSDTSTEFDDTVYFAEMETSSDASSKTIIFETIVGIKSGTPDELNLTVSFYDTDGVKSNDYNLELTSNESEISSSSKTSNTKKAKTTKAKKAKTTKAKTTDEETQEYAEQQSSVNGVTLEDNEVTVDKGKEKAIWIASASVAAVGVLSACVIGIRSRKKNH